MRRRLFNFEWKIVYCCNRAADPLTFQAWDSQYETWYYWNNLTMKVSWLNPDDPESEITDPADKEYGDFAQPTQPSR